MAREDTPKLKRYHNGCLVTGHVIPMNPPSAWRPRHVFASPRAEPVRKRARLRQSEVAGRGLTCPLAYAVTGEESEMFGAGSRV